MSPALLEVGRERVESVKLEAQPADRVGSFFLAFSVRAGVNVLLTLFRTIRKRNLRLYMILHAIFGKEPFRFGAMIGTSIPLISHSEPKPKYGLSGTIGRADTSRHIHLSQHPDTAPTPPRPSCFVHPAKTKSGALHKDELWPARAGRRRG